MPNMEWTEEDYKGLEDVVATLRGHGDEIRAASGTQEPDEASVELERRLEEAIAERDIRQYFDQVADVVPTLYYGGMKFEELLTSLARSSGPFLEALTREHAHDVPRLHRALLAFLRLKDTIAVRAGEVFSALRSEEVEEENRKVIRELSTPVIQVWHGISVMPLVGVIDSQRANQMMEQLLTRTAELRTRIVILDVTGVPAVDTEVANHFLRATRAVSLLGATSIVVGITPRVAQTLVRLNVSFGTLESYSDLRSGLERAFDLLGYRVTLREEP